MILFQNNLIISRQQKNAGPPTMKSLFPNGFHTRQTPTELSNNSTIESTQEFNSQQSNESHANSDTCNIIESTSRKRHKSKWAEDVMRSNSESEVTLYDEEDQPLEKKERQEDQPIKRKELPVLTIPSLELPVLAIPPLELPILSFV